MNTTHGQNSQTKTETVRTMVGKPVATIRTNPSSGVQRGYDNRQLPPTRKRPGKVRRLSAGLRDGLLDQANGLAGQAAEVIAAIPGRPWL
jgi:NAD(P)H-dependent flavin oxidoreductase YrpB (nitropropane dioxygenase family)